MTGKSEDRVPVLIEISVEDFKLLEGLVGAGPWAVASNVPDLVWYLAKSAADGVRRPGSWERGWILQATGAEL